MWQLWKCSDGEVFATIGTYNRPGEKACPTCRSVENVMLIVRFDIAKGLPDSAIPHDEHEDFVIKYRDGL